MQTNKNGIRFGSSLMKDKKGILPEEIAMKKCIHCEKKNKFITTDPTIKHCPICGRHLVRIMAVPSVVQKPDSPLKLVDKVCTGESCNKVHLDIPELWRFCPGCGHHLKEMAGQKIKRGAIKRNLHRR